MVEEISAGRRTPREKPLSEEERSELERLRKDNAKLEMQLSFAKKVSTWFANGQQ
ncbi:hypothetical protein [Arthrobacter sp. A5]|uniref:hypothetical protein n=1 Tax=Arthrobacter sp. A5 TaxID=576926 RepID=UPI003DA8E47E